jgi:hypothetical protein
MPRTTKARAKKARKRAPKRSVGLRPLPPTETVQEALVGIAQDAVLILRRGLAYHFDRITAHPSALSVSDCTALLRLMAEFGPAAAKSANGEPVRVDYSRLSPEELAQYAALSLKVDCA